MKALAIISTTLLIVLGVLFGLSHYREDTSSSESVLALETAQLRIESIQNELNTTRTDLTARTHELEQARRALAQAKTLENGLRLQINEGELKNRKLQSDISDLKSNFDTLQTQHRQLKSELVNLHSPAANTGTGRQ